MNYYNAKEILAQRADIPLIDVRTPAEYAQGHIPGAYNLPLFTNEERAEVGTLYVKHGKEKAVEKGFEFVGPKMHALVKEVKDLTGSRRRINIHCWRGGMRSASIGWLLETAGYEVGLMTGGYKAYRSYIRADFLKPAKLCVLGGMTGSGKTEILHYFKEHGEQVIDLEGLACHRGSAFGGLGQEEQPTTEMFENIVWEEWNQYDVTRPIWMEDESKAIGSVWINENLYARMQDAELICLNLPFDVRVDRLNVDYGHFDKENLKCLVQRIGKRLGGDNVKIICEAIASDDLKGAISIVLKYYDKSYSYALSKKPTYLSVTSETGDIVVNANLLLSLKK